MTTEELNRRRQREIREARANINALDEYGLLVVLDHFEFYDKNASEATIASARRLRAVLEQDPERAVAVWNMAGRR